MSQRKPINDKWAWVMAFTFLALWVAFVVAEKAGAQTPATETLCSIHTDQAWPDTTVYVSGVEVSGTVTVTTEPDGSERRCVDVPGLVRPYAVSVTSCNAAGCTDGVLIDDRPQPLAVYRSMACRADLNDDGRVGTADFLPYSRHFLDYCVP